MSIGWGGDSQLPEEDGGGSKGKGVLATLLGASALGVSLTNDPVGFVQAVVLKWIVGTLVDVFGGLAYQGLVLFDVFAEEVIVASGVEVARALGPVGDTLLWVVRAVGDVINAGTAALGPVAPFAAIVLWGLVSYLVVRGVVLLWNRLPQALALVIPWL